MMMSKSLRPLLSSIACLILVIGFFVSADDANTAMIIDAPFSSQAPDHDWSQPWFDACEETVILMADYYYAGKSLHRDTTRDAILQVFRIKNGNIGESLDETAATMAELINNFFPWEVTVVENPSLWQMKREIDAGRPIILPADGKALQNPHFRNGGPPYHVVLIIGYDDVRQEFIAHDPGTQFGRNYRYSYNRIMNEAMHDFVPGAVSTGRKVALFTQKTPTQSADTDGDRDGLTKQKEIEFGTILWLRDSDGDGFTDGQEVQNGYSPTKAGNTLRSTLLFKSAADPKVYMIEDGKKRHIASEAVFLAKGFSWNLVQTVGDALINSFESGAQLLE